MLVAIASPTRGGNHVLISECKPSSRVTAAANAFDGTNTVVLKDVPGSNALAVTDQAFNRLLRHTLRNRLDAVRSHAERLAEQTDGEHAEAILSATDRLRDQRRRVGHSSGRTVNGERG